MSTATADVDKAEDGKLMRRAARASLCISILLVVLKFVGFLATNSIALLASLADSGLDVFTSSINLIAVKSSLTPPDREHRFGHGKAEPLAGLVQGAFILGSATFLVIEAVNRLIEPRPVERAALGLSVMGVSIAAATGLVLYQRIVVRRTRSLAIRSDQMHYFGDLLTNIGAALGIFLASQFHWLIADPLLAIAIALVLGFSAYSVIGRSYDQLMDRELPEAERAKIKMIVRNHHAVRNLHDLRTRAAGLDTFIQFHIELDPAISLLHAHQLSDAVEAEVCAAFPHAEVIIHQDPAGLEQTPTLRKT